MRMERIASEANRGGQINVITWVLMTVAMLAVWTKVITKKLLLRKLQSDDLYMALSMLSAVGYTISLANQVESGLGGHQAAMTANQRKGYGLAQYASEFSYILSLGLAKVGLVQYLSTLTKCPRRLKVIFGVVTLNMLFMGLTLFPTAFQCSLPRPWDVLGGHCFNKFHWAIGFAVLDILTDVSTIALPIYILHDVRISQSSKTKAILAFCARVINLLAILARLNFIHDSQMSGDVPYHDFNIAIMTSTHIAASTIASCMPFLKPVLKDLRSGVLDSEVHALSSVRTSRHQSYPGGLAGQPAAHRAESSIDSPAKDGESVTSAFKDLRARQSFAVAPWMRLE